MEHHHFSWANPLFLWPCSIAMLVHQRVSRKKYHDTSYIVIPSSYDPLVIPLQDRHRVTWAASNVMVEVIVLVLHQNIRSVASAKWSCGSGAKPPGTRMVPLNKIWYYSRICFIHPAPRGVAAHTAGYFSSYTLNSSALL